MSISANYPALRPALLLDFANSQQLDPRVTFSRSTTAPYYDGKTSVLAEQNLTVQSQDWTQSVWIKTGLTVTANNWVAPDGTTTGTLLTSTTSTAGSTGTYQSITFAIGSTISFYATAGTANFIGALVGGVGCYANFNLGTGAVASSTGCTPSMVSIGGGTYRCIIANTSISGTVIILTGKDADPAASPWVNGVWTSGSTVKVWGFQVENRSSPTAYNPTTTSAITNYIPQLLTAPINAPRFDFNPTTGESLGLLIEQSSTNLLTYSQDFSNAVWTKSNVTITTGANIAPDGTQTANIIQVTTTATTSVLQSSSGSGSASGNTFSTYVKIGNQANAFNFFALYNITTATTLISGTLNFSTGVFSYSVGSTGASVVSVGNGWWRLSLTATTGISAGNTLSCYVGAGGNSQTAGNFFYIWGAQLEALPLATSYIPTTSAQVTRASDNASMTGTNFSSWYNISEGTIYSETSAYALNGTNWCISDGTSANRILSGFDATYNLFVSASGVTQAQITVGSFTANTYGKVAGAYKTNDFAVSLNASLAGTDTLGVVPAVNQLQIGGGAGNASGSVLNGRIKKISYYPIRVTNTQLQSLTGS